MKIHTLVTSTEFVNYKKDIDTRHSKLNIDHVGVPEKFPVAVIPTRKTLETGKVQYTHHFFYQEDLQPIISVFNTKHEKTPSNKPSRVKAHR